GGGCGALVLERRFVRWVGFGQRGDTNLLRGVPRSSALSRVCSICCQDLAHDPLCFLEMMFNPVNAVALQSDGKVIIDDCLVARDGSDFNFRKAPTSRF